MRNHWYVSRQVKLARVHRKLLGKNLTTCILDSTFHLALTLKDADCTAVWCNPLPHTTAHQAKAPHSKEPSASSFRNPRGSGTQCFQLQKPARCGCVTHVSRLCRASLAMELRSARRTRPASAGNRTSTCCVQMPYPTHMRVGYVGCLHQRVICTQLPREPVRLRCKTAVKGSATRRAERRGGAQGDTVGRKVGRLSVQNVGGAHTVGDTVGARWGGSGRRVGARREGTTF